MGTQQPEAKALTPLPPTPLQRSHVYLGIMCCGGRWESVLVPTPQPNPPNGQDAPHTWPALLWARTVLSHWHWLVYFWGVHQHTTWPARLPASEKPAFTECLLPSRPFSPGSACCSPCQKGGELLSKWPFLPLHVCQQCPQTFLPSPWKRSPMGAGSPAGPRGGHSQWTWSCHGQTDRQGTHRESQHHLMEVLIPHDSLLYCSKGILGTGQDKRRISGGMGPPHPT